MLFSKKATQKLVLHFIGGHPKLLQQEHQIREMHWQSTQRVKGDFLYDPNKTKTNLNGVANEQ